MYSVPKSMIWVLKFENSVSRALQLVVKLPALNFKKTKKKQNKNKNKKQKKQKPFWDFDTKMQLIFFFTILLWNVFSLKTIGGNVINGSQLAKMKKSIPDMSLP